ncbi:MAG: Holliday junction resolvase RuvX [Acidobacteriota bacterium]
MTRRIPPSSISTPSGPGSGISQTRVLALDLWSRRISVAVSDPLGLTAQGLETLVRKGKRADTLAIVALARDFHVARIVVGWPLTLDGEEGMAARAAARFVRQLQRTVGRPVELWDERLTTAQVERVLLEAGSRRRQRRETRDRLAAVVLLQSWLDARTGGHTNLSGVLREEP